MTLKLNSNEIECIKMLDEAVNILGNETRRNRVLIFEYLKLLTEYDRQKQDFFKSVKEYTEKVDVMKEVAMMDHSHVAEINNLFKSYRS